MPAPHMQNLASRYRIFSRYLHIIEFSIKLGCVFSIHDAFAMEHGGFTYFDTTYIIGVKCKGVAIITIFEKNRLVKTTF